MDQFNQTNNLQQAIDEVANKDENTNQFGIPPMPPTEGEGAPAPFGEAATTGATDAAAGPSAEQILSGGLATDNSGAVEAPAIGEPSMQAEGSATDAAPVAAVETPVAPAVTPAPEAPVVQPEVSAETPTVQPEVSAEAPADGDLASIRENVIKDLLPLMDKVDSSPEEKFEIYKDAMKTMHDASTIGGAYRTATQFSDETKKADALMDLMKTIDNA